MLVRRMVAFAGLGGFFSLGLTGVGLLAGRVSPALAAGPAPVCSAGTCSVTFSSTGTGESFTVPAGVSSLSVTLYGGVGGTNYNSNVSGGDGATVTASLSVTHGETLGVDVGGVGQGGPSANNPGGVNGGGTGHYSGGGGGATDVTSSATRLLVAGGGGGAGADAGSFDATSCHTGALVLGGAGGNADNPGSTGQATSSGTLTLGAGSGGSKGTTSGPGAGGPGGTATGTDPCSGGAASNGSGGAAGSGGGGGSAGSTYAGAGGGGYFGGGAGGDGASETSSLARGGSGGGAGGASYTAGVGVTNASVNDAGNSGTVNSGNGEAVFSYPDPIATGAPSYSTTIGHSLTVDKTHGLLSSTAGTSGPVGDTLTASGPPAGATTKGGTVAVNADGSFTYTAPSTSFTGTDSFAYTVSDGSDYTTATSTIHVNPPDAALHITRVSARTSTNRAADAKVSFTDADPAGKLSQYSGTISWGDGVTSTIPKSQFSVVPPGSGGGFAAHGTHKYTKAGKYTVTITINDVGGASAKASTTLVVR